MSPSKNNPRTDYRFDPCPWKVSICNYSLRDCPFPSAGVEGTPALRIDGLPEPPEPGRVREGADHVHILPKYSGSNDARAEEKWRSMLFSTVRCEHGRMQGDRCAKCPDGQAPDAEGTFIGTTYDGRPVRTPGREYMRDIRSWIGLTFEDPD